MDFIQYNEAIIMLLPMLSSIPATLIICLKYKTGRLQLSKG